MENRSSSPVVIVSEIRENQAENNNNDGFMDINKIYQIDLRTIPKNGRVIHCKACMS